MTEPVDRKDLIIMALKQRMGEMVVMYESSIAELRATLTIESAVKETLDIGAGSGIPQ